VVGHRLEHREVAVVGVGERLLEILELLGHLRQLAHDAQQLLAAGLEELLDARARAQVEVAEREERARLLLQLDEIVPALERVLPREPVPGLVQIEQHARIVGRHRLGRLGDAKLRRAEDVEDQHGVVRHHRATRLGDDVRVRHVRLVAGLLDRGHDVVGVLLHRVVHRRREVGLRAVVVDAEAAADVEQVRARAHRVQADEDPARLAQRVLVGADRGDLRADVEVHELEAVEHVLGAQAVDRLDDLRRRQAELAALAARVGPLADALGHQPRADADVRPDADVARHADHHVELGEAVDHEDRGAAEALRHERGLDVAAVLVAVADEQRARRVEQRERDDQLGLAADLEADPVRRAEADDLLHDVALLVDLDRVDAAEAPSYE
jgi:hypothetical protein